LVLRIISASEVRTTSLKGCSGRTSSKRHSSRVTENPSKYDRRGSQESETQEWKCCEEREFPFKSLEIMIVVSGTL
jgi:hypothetical protein